MAREQAKLAGLPTAAVADFPRKACMKGEARLRVATAVALLLGGYEGITHPNLHTSHPESDMVSELNSVNVYRRHKPVERPRPGPDGYNLGMRYQCLEFVQQNPGPFGKSRKTMPLPHTAVS
jgi:hypothetical protein